MKHIWQIVLHFIKPMKWLKLLVDSSNARHTRLLTKNENGQGLWSNKEQFYKNSFKGLQPIYNVLILSILITGFMRASSPHISINQSFVSPRLHIFDEQIVENYQLTSFNQNFHWQTQIDYRQELFSKFTLHSFFEYGSETDFNPQPFRIHNLYTEYSVKNNTIKLGRIPLWNPFMMNTVDGLMASVNLKKWGTISLTGGFESSEIDSTLFSDKFFVSSWTLRSKRLKNSIYYWYQNEKSYIGSSSKLSTFGGINITGNFSWNLTDNQKYYYRINISKHFSKHLFNINYRVKEIDVSELYPWVENANDLWVSPTLSVGLTSRLAKVFTLQNIVGYRFTESENWFYKTALNWKMLQTSVMIVKQSNSHILSNSVAGRFRFNDSISLGGSLMLNMIYLQEYLDQEQSFGTNMWLKWSIIKNFTLQIFARYYQNPYYTVDARGGINLNYAF